MKVLVTGGMGFVGSALILELLADPDTSVVNLDTLTYAANPASLAGVANDPRYRFEHADIADRAAVTRIFAEHRPDAVVNLAAESHVDRSIDAPDPFLRTNVEGTHVLLEAARVYWRGLAAGARSAFRFHHVSTDEVYGDLADGAVADEATPYAPSSPYAASKAAADHLVSAWHRTYGLPVLLSNSTNSYGPRQFPEKLIPLTILNALDAAPLPVYGDGQQVRDWLHVEDHARALVLILTRGTPGRRYHVSSETEQRNIDVVHLICREIDAALPGRLDRPHRTLIDHVADRPGHDRRYALASRRLRDELGWTPRVSFADGLGATVRWYLDNREWWEPLRGAVYRGERLGLATGGGR